MREGGQTCSDGAKSAVVQNAGTARSDHGAVVAAAREGVEVAVAVAAVAGWLFVVRAAVVQRKDGQLSVSACLSSLRDSRACPRLVRPGGTVPQSPKGTASNP